MKGKNNVIARKSVKRRTMNVLERMEEEYRTTDWERIPEERQTWNIPADEGKFLNLLARVRGARRILEIGMSIGYSTIWLAEAALCNGGSVTTIERMAWKLKAARENFRQAGVSKLVKIMEGDGMELVERLRFRPDFVFLDADKEDYFEFAKMLIPKMMVGGILAADNAISHRMRMLDFIEFLEDDKRVENVTVPIGNGVELAYKLRE